MASLPDSNRNPERSRRPSAGRERARQLHREGRPATRLARQRDGAAVGLHHLARDPQAEAQAAEASTGYGALEALEHAGLVAGTDANAVIADLEARDRKSTRLNSSH